MYPPAPGLFSMTTDWPSASPSSWVTWRDRVSVAPPGGNAITRRIGRSGYNEGVCACAKAAAPNTAHATKPHRDRHRSERLGELMSVSQPKGAVQCSPRLFSCKQQEKNRGSKRHARKINGK